MDKSFALSKLRALKRHLEGFNRGVEQRVDSLLKEEIDDGERGELVFLTKTLHPPLKKSLEDLKALEREIAE